jgi:hypothetical protein
MKEFNIKNILPQYADILSHLGFSKSKILYFIQEYRTLQKGIKSADFNELFYRWYFSLNNKNPDYSVYNDDLYLVETLDCFKKYSRTSILSILTGHIEDGKSVHSLLSKVRTVVDLGNGLGYTTAMLSKIFDNSIVFGTNIKDSIQDKYNEFLIKEYNYKLKYDIDELSQSDLVVALEYFEHFEDPILHITDIIYKLNPKFLFIANAFSADAIGHFNVYTYGNIKIPCNKIGRIFNDTLRNLGYKKVKTDIWNSRPALWMKVANKGGFSELI